MFYLRFEFKLYFNLISVNIVLERKFLFLILFLNIEYLIEFYDIKFCKYLFVGLKWFKINKWVYFWKIWINNFELEVDNFLMFFDGEINLELMLNIYVWKCVIFIVSVLL